MEARRALLATVVPLLLAAAGTPGCTEEDRGERIRKAILHSRQLGAHGLGYGERSLEELSDKLQPADIPNLIALASDRYWRTGAQFALASQCEPAVAAIRDAAARRRIEFPDASDALRLLSGYAGCPEAVRRQARETIAEIESLRQAEEARAGAAIERQKEEDARIRGNATTLMQGGAQAQTLTRGEKEEIFRRSLRGMGLPEKGPMTPQQRQLADRMYRSMVLGDPGASSDAQRK
jgi:hypothetical protein